MTNLQQQFKIPSQEELAGMPVKVMGAIYKEGVAHLKYFAETQNVFAHPEKRVKTFDTIYYESVLPIIIPILRENKQWKSKIK